METIEKFYPPSFNPAAHWESRHLQAYSVGKNAEEFRSQTFWPLLQKHLAKDKFYVDAGCGSGGWVLFLTDEGYTVEGVDESQRVLQAMTEYNPDVKVKVASSTALPYTNAMVDGVLAIGTLEYAQNEVKTTIEEMKRVIKPGGILFLEIPILNALRRWFYLPLKRQERAWRMKKGEKPQFAYYLFDVEEMKDMLKKEGFDIVAVQPHEIPGENNHYGLYVDWSFLRGKNPYELNIFGQIVKAICNSISPWIASTGAVIVARKK